MAINAAYEIGQMERTNKTVTEPKEGIPEYASIQDEAEHAVASNNNYKDIPEYVDIYDDNHISSNTYEYAVVDKEEGGLDVAANGSDIPTYETVKEKEDGKKTEGWKVNSIYATTDDGNHRNTTNEGWEDNIIYATGN